MEQAVEVQREGVTSDAPAEPSPPAAAPAPKTSRLPGWWRRDHPVFVPLAGFFTGMTYIILVPGTYAWVLKVLFGYDRAAELFPFVLLTLVVPFALLVPHRSRRFGRYMLLGVVATAVVVIGVAGAVLYVLYNRDR